MSQPTPLLPPLTEPGQRHLLHQLVQFSRSLHAAGLAVDSSRLINVCRCMPFIDLRNPLDFYAATRTTMVSAQEDIPVFDRIFTEFWQPHGSRAKTTRDRAETPDEEESGRKPGAKAPRLTRSPTDEDGQEPDSSEAQTSYSPHEILMKKDFRLMSEEELEQARRLVSELIAILAMHASRRRTISQKRSDLDLRRMLRRNALRALDGMEFRYRKKRIKRTRLLLLCDVSGSMERYSRFLIQFIYAMRQQLARIDVAVFSTRLTVITDFLGWRSVEQSLRDVSAHVQDWGGGTDIGGCLQQFNDRFAAEMLQSHTVAIILSDGWDQGDASRLREEMQLLHQRAHRVLWLNPLLGNADYQPLCKGIRTAMPFIDQFLPAHNLESFAELLRHLRAAWR